MFLLLPLLNAAELGSTTLKENEMQEIRPGHPKYDAVAKLIGVEPNEPGGFIGDIFFGDPRNSTRGTHRWSGAAWELLPSDEEVLTSLLAQARTERDEARALLEEAEQVLKSVSDWVTGLRLERVLALLAKLKPAAS